MAQAATSSYDTYNEGGSPFFTIWLSPRATIRRQIEANPTQGVLLITALAGISSAISNVSQNNLGDTVPIGGLVAACAILGPVVAIAALYGGSLLLSWVGTWLEGDGTPEEVRCAYAWCQVPAVVTFLLQILILFLIGEELFTSATPKLDSSGLLESAFLGFAVIEAILGVWMMVLFFKCLAEAHQFSVWRAMGTAILSSFVVMLPILILVAGFVVLFGAAALSS